MSKIYIDVLSLTPDLDTFEVEVRYRWKTQGIQVDEAEVFLSSRDGLTVERIKDRIEEEIKTALQRNRLEHRFADEVTALEEALVAKEWTADI